MNADKLERIRLICKNMNVLISCLEKELGGIEDDSEPEEGLTFASLYQNESCVYYPDDYDEVFND